MSNPSQKRFVWCREDTYRLVATLANDTDLSMAVIMANLMGHAYKTIYGAMEPGETTRRAFLRHFPQLTLHQDTAQPVDDK